MENPKAFIKQAWVKKHGKAPSPKIIAEIIALAEKTHAHEKTTDLATHVMWWNRLYMSESRIVKGKFVYYHDDGFSAGEMFTKKVEHIAEKRAQRKTPRLLASLGVVLKWLTLFFSGFVLIVVICAFLIKFSALIIPDAGAVNDSDLRFGGVVIPEEDNAYFAINDARALLKSPEESKSEKEEREVAIDTMISGGEWNALVASEMLEHNKDAVAGFYAAAKKQTFILPGFAQNSAMIDIFAPTGSLGGYPKLAKLAALDAITLVRNKKDNQGMDQAFEIVRMGYLIEHAEHGPLMQYLVGTGVKNIGLKTVQTIANTGRFTVKERAAYAKALEAYRNDGTEIVNFFKGEYATLSGLLESVGDGSLLHKQNVAANGRAIPSFSQVIVEYFQRTPSFYFYENETRALLADATRAYTKDAVTACSDPVLKRTQLADPIVNNTVPVNYFFTRNIIGKRLVDKMAAVAPLFKDNFCRQQELITETAQVIVSKTK